MTSNLNQSGLNNWEVFFFLNNKATGRLTPVGVSSGNISEGTQNSNLKEHKHPMFTAALFTVAKIWKQPKCPSIDEWIEQLWDNYTTEYYSAVKFFFTICDSMDGPGEHYAE